MNTQPQYTPIPPEEAIPLWNQLASTNPTKLTHAHNPLFYHFYTTYLKLNAWYFILYKNQAPIALLPLTTQKPTASTQYPAPNTQHPTAPPTIHQPPITNHPTIPQPPTPNHHTIPQPPDSYRGTTNPWKSQQPKANSLPTTTH